MKKATVTVLTLALVLMLTAVAPAFAKNMNLPEGANAITYWSGGICVVEMTSTWPPYPAAPTTTVRIDVRHHESGTYGAGDTLNIDVLSPSGNWLPVSYFTTNTNAAFLTFIRNVYYKLPIGAGSINAQYVSANNLKVERHGNRITAELDIPVTVSWAKIQPDPTHPTPPYSVRVDVPAFKLELDKTGGSFHRDFEEDLAGYSNYVFYEDMMGFDANGVITCSAWNLDNQLVTFNPLPYCGITMHGITTYFPPTPP